jgi:hypothetical protein
MLKKGGRSNNEMLGSADDFCYWVLGLDKGIRFAGLANPRGKLLGGAYRKGLKPLLTKEEAEESFLSSFTKATTHVNMEAKFGPMLYALAMYSNVKRTTIPIKELSKISHILMVSFDPSVEHEPIILHRIMPKINELFS